MLYYNSYMSMVPLQIKNAAGKKRVNDVTLFINNVTPILFHVFNLIPVKTL